MAIAYRCAGYGNFGDALYGPLIGSCVTVLDGTNPFFGGTYKDYTTGSILYLYIIIEFYDDVTGNPIEVSGNAVMSVTDSGVSCGYERGVGQLVSVGWGVPRGTEFGASDITMTSAQQEIWPEDGVYIPIDVPAFSGASKYAFFLRGESRGGTQTPEDPDMEIVLRTSPYIDAISFSNLALMAQPPVASLTATPTSGVAPLAVQFTDTSTETPITWHWDFGDGETSAEQNPLHTYATAGTYTVTLTASNAGGEGTVAQADAITVYEPGPYYVTTYEDLCKVGTGVDGWTLDADYIQTADIQCPAGVEQIGFAPIGDSYTPFEGRYDGGGHAIRDLYVNQNDYHSDAGLFGRVGGGAQIIGVTLTDPVVHGSAEAGGLIGYAVGTVTSHITVTNCHVVRGTVYAESDCGGGLIGLAEYVDLQSCTTSGALPQWHGSYSGGMVGQMNSGSMTDCHSSMSVQPGWYGIGGLIGSLFDTCTITRCSATGQVSGSGVNPSGGLIGSIYTNENGVVTITECFSSGDLDIQLRDEVGGFIGSVEGGYMASLRVDIADCYTRGTIGPLTGYSSNSGGFIGRSDNSEVTLTRCYSSRTITTPDKADGFIGRIWKSSVGIDACYWDTETSGLATSAGGAIGKTTAEMQTLETFDAWSIASAFDYTDETWYIVPGMDYPRLAWEGVPPITAINVSVFGGTEKLLTGRLVPVEDIVAECPTADTMFTAGNVITLSFLGELENGTKIPIQVNAPDRIGVSRSIPYTGTDAKNVVLLWGVASYGRMTR